VFTGVFWEVVIVGTGARHAELIGLTERLEADRVVVASGAHRIPRVPAFASELGPDVVYFLRDARHRVLELTHSAAERLPELRQSLRPEDEQDDDEEDQDLPGADPAGH